ncbi:helix-turn-helix domain-containing protein [Oceanobacillus jordanicus]|uniref:helix-turn-helix domain-containing protein n=1 Tax=Oceanobacillus jordanicus TaxID=2867266 RepID=UPI001EDE3630|nr:AraC family transcriptional regulator [Oceanobacillus jordanicus]
MKIAEKKSISQEQSETVGKAIRYMKENLDDTITLNDLAEFVGYSSFHFSRMFKHVTGISPRYYLSALRIEQGKKLLANPSVSPSVIKTLLSLGFQSIGSFSSRFKQFVGLTPKEFNKRVKELHQFLNEYDGEAEQVHGQALINTSNLMVRIKIPKSFNGYIFIGLFPRPIPDQVPILGKVITHKQEYCVFESIPEGVYYVLTAAIEKSFNPLDYFLLENALRGKYELPISFEEKISRELEITLRPPLPNDPPILINLPKLLFDKIKNKAN